MNKEKYQVRVLKNLSELGIEEMLNDGWELNSVVGFQPVNYHGWNSSGTEREFYFIKKADRWDTFFESSKSSDINREL